MDNFTFYSPTEFVFGKDTENQLGEVAKKHGAKKVLVVSGGKSAKKSGVLDRSINSLKDAGIEVFQIDGVLPNPRADKVYEGIELVRNNDIDFLIGVGGGSAIDTAKAIAIGVPYDGDFFDMYTKKEKNPPQPLPVGTVLTIAAAGSEGSDSTVIQSMDGDKRGFHHEGLRPKFSIMNPELTTTIPPYQTAAGITDMMAHILERYFTTTKNVQLTDQLAEALLRTIIHEAAKVVENPNDYDARANIMWAGTQAHNDLVGVGRKQDWTNHHVEHVLSGVYDVTHGAGLAVLFPAWMEYIYEQDLPRFARFANQVFGVPYDQDNLAATAKEGIKRFRDFLQSIGMPGGLKDLDIPEEDIPMLVEKLGGKDHVEHSIIDLYPEDIENILKIAAKY